MHQIKSTEAIARVRMEARLPVSIRSHGAAAPNPTELMPARPHDGSPLNPLRELLPSRPPGEAGGGPPPLLENLTLTQETPTQSIVLK